MSNRILPIVFRFALAAASMGAMFYQLFAIHIPSGYNVVNFFTYFTNLSNIIISVVFVVTAVRLLRGGSAPTPLRGAAVVYIAFVGLVFNTLLRDVDISNINPAVNVIMHMVLPVAGILDWVLWPPKNRIPLSSVFWWMIFPVVYSVFSLVRGAIDGVYPYPFFNPDAVGGYGAVALYCLGMIVGFLVLAFAVRALGNWRGGFTGRAR